MHIVNLHLKVCTVYITSKKTEKVVLNFVQSIIKIYNTAHVQHT